MVGGENITLSRDLTDSDSGSGTLTIDTKDRLTLTSGITINGSDGMNKMYMYPSYLTYEYTPDPTNAPTDKKSLSIRNSGISYNDSSLGTYGMNATLIGIQNINSKHHISFGNPVRDFPDMPPMEGEVTPDEMILFSKGKSIIVAEGSYSVSESPSYVALKEDIVGYVAGSGVELATPSTFNNVFGTLTANTVADDYTFSIGSGSANVSNQDQLYMLYSNDDTQANVINTGADYVDFQIVDSQGRFKQDDVLNIEMTIQLTNIVTQVGIYTAGVSQETVPAINNTTDQTINYTVTLTQDFDTLVPIRINALVSGSTTGNRFTMKKIKIQKRVGNAYSQQINIVPATASTIGGVKPDGTTITVDASGTLSVSSLETRIAALEAKVTALEGGTA